MLSLEMMLIGSSDVYSCKLLRLASLSTPKDIVDRCNSVGINLENLERERKFINQTIKHNTIYI